MTNENNNAYTKELLKRFHNPKFVKEVKNANAVGEVGNVACGDIMHLELNIDDKTQKIKDIGFKTFGCLPPNEKINLNNSWTEISNISKSDNVLNGEGEEVEVLSTYKGKFNGKLLEIVPFVSRFNSFYVTPLHPVCCIKRKFLSSARKSSNKCDWLRVSKKELESCRHCFVEASYLEVGDYLVFPKIKNTRDNRTFNLDVMKLLGYYLSEGYTSANNSVLAFAFNKNENEYISEVKELIKNIIQKDAKIRTRNNVSEVYVCSRQLVRFFLKHGNKIASKKEISEEVMFLPFKKQWEMIKAYINGDGNIYKRREKDSSTFRISTASEKLAIQIQRILARGDIFASIKKFKRAETKIEGRALKSSVGYTLSFKLKKNHIFIKENNNFFFVPIREINEKKFRGYVHNLEVKGKEHSYLVRGFSVHNCGAAIASSDVVCELAKGKSLKEAKKISKDDIVKKLGGMPKIKIHCSILGIEALNKAIEGYEGKKK